MELSESRYFMKNYGLKDIIKLEEQLKQKGLIVSHPHDFHGWGHDKYSPSFGLRKNGPALAYVDGVHFVIIEGVAKGFTEREKEIREKLHEFARNYIPE